MNAAMVYFVKLTVQPILILGGVLIVNHFCALVVRGQFDFNQNHATAKMIVPAIL